MFSSILRHDTGEVADLCGEARHMMTTYRGSIPQISFCSSIDTQSNDIKLRADPHLMARCKVRLYWNVCVYFGIFPHCHDNSLSLCIENDCKVGDLTTK